MKDSLSHLPHIKADELELIAFNIRALCDDVQMVILFGSYARGDWKNGPHEQGRGRLIIHKRSDYDILVLTANEYTARDIALWDKVKEKLAESNLSTHVRIIARDIDFVNYKLRQGQYFFTEICEQGILPRQTEEEKQLFDLLDYAYIGARYDRHYKITKEQLEQLNPCVRKLHEVTERICLTKIKSFV